MNEKLIAASLEAEAIHNLKAAPADTGPSMRESRPRRLLRTAYVMALTLLSLALATEIAVAASRLSFGGGFSKFLLY
jgi:hypothetical protein